MESASGFLQITIALRTILFAVFLIFSLRQSSERTGFVIIGLQGWFYGRRAKFIGQKIQSTVFFFLRDIFHTQYVLSFVSSWPMLYHLLNIFFWHEIITFALLTSGTRISWSRDSAITSQAVFIHATGIIKIIRCVVSCIQTLYINTKYLLKILT